VTTTKLTSSPNATSTIEAIPKTTISKVSVRVNPLGVRALFSTPFIPTGFFGMGFLVRRAGEGLEGVPHGRRCRKVWANPYVFSYSALLCQPNRSS
jgi:hypothetical protein